MYLVLSSSNILGVIPKNESCAYAFVSLSSFPLGFPII